MRASQQKWKYQTRRVNGKIMMIKHRVNRWGQFEDEVKPIEKVQHATAVDKAVVGVQADNPQPLAGVTKQIKMSNGQPQVDSFVVSGGKANKEDVLKNIRKAMSTLKPKRGGTVSRII